MWQDALERLVAYRTRWLIEDPDHPFGEIGEHRLQAIQQRSLRSQLRRSRDRLERDAPGHTLGRGLA